MERKLPWPATCHCPPLPPLTLYMQGMPQPPRTAKTLAAYLLPNNAVSGEREGKGEWQKFAQCLRAV